MSLNPSITSGNQPVKQTRLEYYEGELAKAKALDAAQAEAKIPPRFRKVHPLPEIFRPGDIAMLDTFGNKLLVRDADVNTNDVRLVDPVYPDNATPWAKDLGFAEMEWNYLNPIKA